MYITAIATLFAKISTHETYGQKGLRARGRRKPLNSYPLAQPGEACKEGLKQATMAFIEHIEGGARGRDIEELDLITAAGDWVGEPSDSILERKVAPVGWPVHLDLFDGCDRNRPGYTLKERLRLSHDPDPPHCTTRVKL